MHKVYFSLGSNLGNRRELILSAISFMAERIGVIINRSSFYETEPWGFESSNMFLNVAVCAETELSPRAILETTQQIERELGRKAKTVQTYSDRPIDIDILLYDDDVIDEPDLKIPHPLMYEREFVMKPLREIMEVS